MPEARVEEEVDEEVDRRVEDHEQVADAAQVELVSAADARRVVGRVPHDEVDERRHLADREDENDDDEHERRVVVRLLARALHLLPAASQPLQRVDEPHVEDAERDERQDEEEDEVEDVAVDDVVELLVTEARVVGAREPHGRVAAGDVELGELDLRVEELRDVVEEREDDDDGQLASRLQHGAEARGAVRHAHGHVAVDGDQHRHPDGGRLRDVGARQQADLHVGEHVGELGPPAGVVEQRAERVERQGGGEQRRVDDGQALEEERRRRLHHVLPEDDERQHVADDADDAERTDDHGQRHEHVQLAAALQRCVVRKVGRHRNTAAFTRRAHACYPAPCVSRARYTPSTPPRRLSSAAMLLEG